MRGSIGYSEKKVEKHYFGAIALTQEIKKVSIVFLTISIYLTDLYKNFKENPIYRSFHKDTPSLLISRFQITNLRIRIY